MAVILLSGPEFFLKEEALDKLKQSTLSKRHQEFNLNVFYGEDLSKDISDELNTAAFLGDNRLVVIKNAERLSTPQKERLLTYIKKSLPQHLSGFRNYSYRPSR